MTLKLAIPSKGRLQQLTIDWFHGHNLFITREGHEREYRATLQGIEGIELILMSAGEIPSALEKGDIDLGVTGQDMIQEKIAQYSERVTEIAPMGFGFADLVFAVPSAWVDVNDIYDLDEVAADFRATHGFRMRIGTKYHRLVGNYLRKYHLTNFQLVDSQGATEGAVANEYVELIADITSTGETIRANHLKTIGAPILRSQAAIFLAQGERTKNNQQILDNFQSRIL